MTEIRTKLGKSGRIVIPTEYRRRLGIEVGDELVMRLDDSGLHLQTQAQALKRAQTMVGRYNPEGRKLSEELIAERKEESSSE